MKNKGFTLIELLATIVILAVIALITMPTIVGVVEKTRRNAAKESALMYKKIISDSIVLDTINSKVHTSGIYQVDEENSIIYNSSEDKIKIKGKGELPSEGYVCLDEKMSVGNYSLKIGNYAVTNINDNVTVTTEEALRIQCYVPEVTINVEDADKWTQSKAVTLNQTSTNKVKLTYKIVYQDGTIEDWKEYKESFNLKKPGTIYTKLENAINVISTSTRTITKIDTEAPSLIMREADTTTSKITIEYTATDTQSGIKTITCAYGEEKGKETNTSNVEIDEENNKCIISKLTKNKTYYYKMTVEDNVGRKTSKDDNATTINMTKPEIEYVNNDGATWTQSKVIKITGSATGAELQYKLGEGNWTKVNSGDTITVTENINVYARLYDGTNTLEADTLTITKIDTTPPTCNGQHGGKTNWTTNQNVTVGVYCSDTQSQCVKDDYTTTISGQGTTGTATFTIADTAGNTATCGAYTYNKYIDTTKPTIGSATGSTATANSGTITVSTIADTGGSGLSGIYISTSSTAPTTSSSWTANTGATYTKSVSANGTYYIWVRDTAGNISDVKTANVSGIVAKVSNVSLGGATVVVGNTVTPSLSYSGTAKSVTYASSNTGIFTVAANRVVTGKSAGSATLTTTITNYDGTTVVKTSTITVQAAIAYSSQTGLNYNSIQAAINATSNGTVKLLRSHGEKLTIASGKIITLNLNTYSISKITNSGTLILSGNGNVSCFSSNQNDNAVENSGTITITNTGITACQYDALYNTGTATVNGNSRLSGVNYGIFNHSGTLTISTSGDIHGANLDGLRMDAGTATISNATISGRYGVINQGGTININSGKVIGTSSAAYRQTSGHFNKCNGTFQAPSSSGYAINISGGTYTQNCGTISCTGKKKWSSTGDVINC